MANTLKELLMQIAIQSGLKDDPIIAKIGSNEQFGEVEIPDEIVNKLDVKQLMTVEAAKHNSDVYSHYKGQNYGTIDNTVDKFLDKLKLDENFLAEYKSEKDTNKKMKMLLNRVSTDLDKEPKAETDEETKKRLDEYSKTITELKTQIGLKDQERENAILEKESSFENERINNLIHAKVSAYKYSDVIPREDSIDLVKRKIMNSDEYSIVRDGNSLKLKQKGDNNLDYTVENKIVSFDEIADNVASTYIAKNPKQPEGTANSKETTSTSSSGVAKTSFNSTYADKNAQRLEAMKASQGS